jgi:hypothetical protein
MTDFSKAEQDALKLLADKGRLLVIVVPEDAPDGFVARLTTWSNYILDTKIMLPLPTPVVRKGNGLVCPYCNLPATSEPRLHGIDCDWREAILRWSAAQLQIAEEFPDS